MADRIILEGLETYAYGGVSEAERTIGQRYRIDVELEVDLTSAAESDRIEDSIHYGQVHDVVVSASREAPFNLIEALAGRIASRVLSTFRPESVTVRVAKLLPPIDGVVAAAAVEVTRRLSH